MQSHQRVRISPYLFHDKNFQPIDRHSHLYYKLLRTAAINHPDGTQLMDIRSGVTVKRTVCADKLPRHPIMKACVRIYKLSLSPAKRPSTAHLDSDGE